MKKALLSIALTTVFLCISALAKESSDAAKSEIVQLLASLEQSNCQFSRNDSWHTSKEAKAHLNKKFEYLVDKGAIASAEQFIELAASKSSMTGRAYMVQCAGSAPIESGIWLSGKLKQLRRQAAR